MGSLDLVHVDYTSIEANAVDLQSTKGTAEIEGEVMETRTINVLVIQDHFTKFLVIKATPNQSAITTARYLWEEFFSILGPPNRLISDKGATFTSGVIKELCALMGVDKIVTCAHHPEGNGQVERANRTIFNMIGTLSKDQKANWSKHLPAIQFAYNSTRSAITGFSPHYLMLNYPPRIPIDFRFPTAQMEQVTRNRNIQKLDEMVAIERCRLRQAIKEARRQTNREMARQQRYYDQDTVQVNLLEGDIVLLMADGFKGKRKSNDRWFGEAWTVQERMGDETSPIYRIKREDGAEKTTHRNKLMLIGPKNSVGITLGCRSVNYDLYAEQTAWLEEIPSRKVCEGERMTDSPQVESTFVQGRLFDSPSGCLGTHSRGIPWPTAMLARLDQTSGFIGTLKAIEYDVG